MFEPFPRLGRPGLNHFVTYWFHSALKIDGGENQRQGDQGPVIQYDTMNMVMVCYGLIVFTSLVGGLVAIFYFPIYWVANHPN